MGGDNTDETWNDSSVVDLRNLQSGAYVAEKNLLYNTEDAQILMDEALNVIDGKNSFFKYLMTRCL